MKRFLPLTILLLNLFLSPSAYAQEGGQSGLVIGLPSAVGFVWHITDRVAIRPELAITHVSNESDLAILSEQPVRGHAVQGGASALWYFGGADGVRPYLSPRFTYERTSFEVDEAVPAFPSESNVVSVTGSFGVQYSPVRRFAVYGEVGYGLSRVKTTIQSPISTRTAISRSWSTRSSVGVVLYFK